MPLRRIRFKRLWRLTVDAACFLHASGYAPRITANRLLVCLLSIHVTAGVAAAPPNVDTFVRDYMTRRQIPGVAVPGAARRRNRKGEGVTGWQMWNTGSP